METFSKAILFIHYNPSNPRLKGKRDVFISANAQRPATNVQFYHLFSHAICGSKALGQYKSGNWLTYFIKKGDAGYTNTNPAAAPLQLQNEQQKV